MVAVPDRKQHGTFVLCRLVKNLIQARKRLLMKLIIFLLLQIGKRWHNFWTKYWKSGHSDLDSVSFVLYLRMPCRCFQHSFVQTILVQESSLFCFLKKIFKKIRQNVLGRKYCLTQRSRPRTCGLLWYRIWMGGTIWWFKCK